MKTCKICGAAIPDGAGHPYWCWNDPYNAPARGWLCDACDWRLWLGEIATLEPIRMDKEHTPNADIRT